MQVRHIRNSPVPHETSTTVEPDHRLRIEPAPPTRLQPSRRPWRGLAAEAFDAVAVRAQRLLSDLPPLRAIHRRSLRRGLVEDVPLRVGAERRDLHGLRIAFLSDLHAGCFCSAAELELLFARTLLLRPDLVALGGDLVGSRPRDLTAYDGPLQRLTDRVPVFAVPGNHDREWGGPPEVWQEFLERRGVILLANRGARIRRGADSLWLCGVDDLTHGRPDTRRALFGRDHGEPTLVLAHQPDHFDEFVDERVDLMLSGHTHGGQIKVRGRALIHHSRHGYVEGAFAAQRGQLGAVGGVSRLHVSRGAGCSLLPLRIGSPVELTLVRLIAE